jgi:hypothetical protein
LPASSTTTSTIPCNAAGILQRVTISVRSTDSRVEDSVQVVKRQ